MERKLLLKKSILSIILILSGFYLGVAQSITNLMPDPNVANRVSFTLTNGNSQDRHFLASQQGVMRYVFQISELPTSGFQNTPDFIIANPPVGNGMAENYERNFSPPNTLTPGTYYIRMFSRKWDPDGFIRYSNTTTIELFYDVAIEGLSDMGYVRCQTPAVSYRLATVRNTGNLRQAYDLSLDPNINTVDHPTEQNLASDIISLQGNPINSTPMLNPGATYSFMVRIAAIQGTQPSKNNYTALIATAQDDSNVSHYEVIHTWTYCGNGNSLPDNPDAPDLVMIKDGPTDWVIGEQMTYTLTLFNNTNTTREAIFPTITDSIPVNLDIVNIYKAPPGEMPNINLDRISLSFDDTTRVLEVTYATNNQNKFLPGNYIIVYIDAIPNCYVTPEVINTAFASNGAGDSNNDNNVSSVYSNMIFDTSNQVNWTGRLNEDWFECANWDKGLVPNADISATIPTVAGNNPIIDSASPLSPANETAEVRDITIMNSKSLEMINSTLEVNGNWTNNWGMLIPGNGTVAFVGSDVDQTILDLSEEPTFYNLTVNTSNNVKVLIADGHGLFVNNQLNLESGVLRLEGLSQLIQPTGATVYANTGKLWRDQRGQANMFNYNYWSSPVGNGSSTYNLASVMKDGSDVSNPQNIQWTGSPNVNFTTPISVSTRWTHKFESTGPQYANWQKINQNTTLNAGQGYTMKGSGNPDPSGTQNYIFVGVPFTGNITHTISDGQITLLGNPYTSAMDANEFIDDNSGVIDGTLEFWDHFQSTNSHNLSLYKGGYAKYNKVGAPIPAVNNDGAVSSRIPQRYIPVGQGFFVSAANGISGNSTIEFKNSQRVFVKEDDAGGMQLYGIPDGQNASTANFDEPTRIRLNMVSAENYRHQIAIGFMQDKATEGIDYGYDAILRDRDPNQFYFMHPEAKLLIQGVGYFDEDKKYPLGVIAEVQGRYTFSIDQIENLSENTAVYLYDNEKQIYHNLRNSDYLVSLAKGEHNTRFSLRFKNHNLDNNLNAQEMLSNIVVYRQNDQIVISNPVEQLTVLNARMYNVLGQEVTSWNISNGRESYIELPLRSLSSGIYVVQVQTDNGVVSKKINIR